MAFVARKVQGRELVFDGHGVHPFFDLLSRNLEHFLGCFYQKANLSVLTL